MNQTRIKFLNIYLSIWNVIFINIYISIIFIKLLV